MISFCAGRRTSLAAFSLAVQLLILSVPVAAQQPELQVVPAPPPPDGDPYYNFDVGGKVAISDEWLAVADFTVNHATGEVYMYRRTPAGWEFRQRLVGESTGTAFGGALAIDGDRLVVGGWYWSGLLGKAYVFHCIDGVWTKVQEILPDGLVKDDHPQFGYAVALSGGVLAVGAREVDHPVESAGELRVYEEEGGQWQAVARFHVPLSSIALDPHHLALGRSIAISGDTIVSGAPLFFGYVHVFERGTNGWVRSEIIENPSPVLGDSFGHAVAIEGDILVVGRPHRSGSPAIGKAFVFERGADGTWHLQDELRASDGFVDSDRGDLFGQSVALVGDQIVVGASRGRYSGPETGTVYLFTRGPDGWPATETMRLVASDSSGMSDFLGESVAMHGGFIAAGAPGGWDEGIREGKAYTFAVELAEPYCEPSPTHTVLGVTGSATVADDDLVLTLRGALEQVRVMYVYAGTRGVYPFGGSFLCLGAPLARLGYGTTGPQGIALLDLNLGAPWLSSHLVPGSTWHFQAVHERQPGDGLLRVLTNAASLTLR